MQGRTGMMAKSQSWNGAQTAFPVLMQQSAPLQSQGHKPARKSYMHLFGRIPHEDGYRAELMLPSANVWSGQQQLAATSYPQLQPQGQLAPTALHTRGILAPNKVPQFQPQGQLPPTALQIQGSLAGMPSLATARGLSDLGSAPGLANMAIAPAVPKELSAPAATTAATALSRPQQPYMPVGPYTERYMRAYKKSPYHSIVMHPSQDPLQGHPLLVNPPPAPDASPPAMPEQSHDRGLDASGLPTADMPPERAQSGSAAQASAQPDALQPYSQLSSAGLAADQWQVSSALGVGNQPGAQPHPASLQHASVNQSASFYPQLYAAQQQAAQGARGPQDRASMRTSALHQEPLQPHEQLHPCPAVQLQSYSGLQPAAIPGEQRDAVQADAALRERYPVIQHARPSGDYFASMQPVVDTAESWQQDHESAAVASIVGTADASQQGSQSAPVARSRDWNSQPCPAASLEASGLFSVHTSSQQHAAALHPGPDAFQQPHAHTQLGYHQSMLPVPQPEGQSLHHHPRQLTTQEYRQQNLFSDAHGQRALQPQQPSGSVQDYSDISFEPLSLEPSTSASSPHAQAEQHPDDLSAYEAAEQHYEEAVQHSLLWNETSDQV